MALKKNNYFCEEYIIVSIFSNLSLPNKWFVSINPLNTLYRKPVELEYPQPCI
jgi:hypothetical protein